MRFFKIFSPIFLFLILFVGSGTYFTYQNIDMAFYQISPTVAIIPAIVLAFCLLNGPAQERLNSFLDGLRHRDIVTMCLIFLLAGAFNTVTKSIGCVEATVNLVLSLIPSEFVLIGVFLTAAFISTAIGTSMGTIATMGPIAVGIANHGAIPIDLGIATVIGGAMFGDSLSPVGDTTIAAVLSQQADFRKKLILNAIVACIAAILMIALLWRIHTPSSNPIISDYNFVLIIPYLLLVILAFAGFNVFQVLISGLITTGLIGYWQISYSIVDFAKDINKGFESMHEIFLLSLFVGGLANMLKDLGAMTFIINFISKAHHLTKRSAQLVIGALVSVFDVLIANNTVAIIFSGEMAKTIANKYRIPSHYTAAWLDIFSCVFQGILPYGAQILLASTLAGVSPLLIAGQVYYCYILGVVAVLYILLKPVKN
jgi:Na+/H+ antiporter NhaC